MPGLFTPSTPSCDHWAQETKSRRVCRACESEQQNPNPGNPGSAKFTDFHRLLESMSMPPERQAHPREGVLQIPLLYGKTLWQPFCPHAGFIHGSFHSLL
ncbi:hypothetical protein DPEC_G00282960 [Dallia pectoralis]|uniref:Uncharacterized protein n=1 Tax=Dallia pectoralis TaxID=75939 RepID=A0ACC2FJ01_DALPE|nr:hypothetical protein DPEC_G00282960 [Dallia pectoralis]